MTLHIQAKNWVLPYRILSDLFCRFLIPFRYITAKKNIRKTCKNRFLPIIGKISPIIVNKQSKFVKKRQFIFETVKSPTEAFTECRTPLLDSYLAIFSAMEYYNFLRYESILPSVWILLINFDDRRTRNAGDIGADLKFVECSTFCLLVEM